MMAVRQTLNGSKVNMLFLLLTETMMMSLHTLEEAVHSQD